MCEFMATSTKLSSKEKEVHAKIEGFLNDYFAEQLRHLRTDDGLSDIYKKGMERPYKIKVESAERRGDMNYDVAFRDVKYKESAKRSLSKCIMSIKEDEMKVIKWVKLDLVGPLLH